jgi:hypothetical protein
LRRRPSGRPVFGGEWTRNARRTLSVCSGQEAPARGSACHTYLSENGAQPDWYIGWLIGRAADDAQPPDGRGKFLDEADHSPEPATEPAVGSVPGHDYPDEQPEQLEQQAGTRL